MDYRSLISILDLSSQEVDELHAAAELFLPRIVAGGFKDSILKGTSAVLLFYESSTRTRASFEIAGKMLGIDTINVSARGSSIEKGETIQDTAETLDAMHFDTVVMRHEAADAVALFARHFKRSVLNAGSGRGQHPTQALLDSLTLRLRGRFQAGTRLAIVGDLKHSRVMRSDLQLFLRRGMHITLVAPPQLMPTGWTGLRPELWLSGASKQDQDTPGSLTWSTDLDAVLPQQDAVMLLRMQRERMAGGLITSIDEYSRLYGLFGERLKRLKPDALIMHPGPVNRGVEIGEQALSDPRCVVADQVTCGVAVRCALLCWSMGKLNEAVKAMQAEQVDSV